MIGNIIIVVLVACLIILLIGVTKDEILIHRLQSKKNREYQKHLLAFGIELTMNRVKKDMMKELDPYEQRSYRFSFIPYMSIHLKHLESGISLKYEMGLGRFGNKRYPLEQNELELINLFDEFNETLFWDNKEIESSLARLLQLIKEYEYINS